MIPFEGSDGKICHLTHFRCNEANIDDYGNCYECNMGYTLNSKKLCVKKALNMKMKARIILLV